MGPIKATIRCMSNPLTWAGRARPSEYWWFVLISTLGITLLSLVWMKPLFEAIVYAPQNGAVLTDAEANVIMASLMSGSTFWCLTIFSIWTMFSQTAVLIRRLHDTDRSGWWCWISLVPVVGYLILLVLTVLPGDPNRNSYGPPPGKGSATPVKARAAAPLGDVDPIGRPRSEVDKVQGAEALRALRQSRMPG